MHALIVNDVHICPTRVAGTTPATAAALRQYIQSSFEDLIFQHLDKHLIINGDLLDGFEIDTKELIQVYDTLVSWAANSSQNSKLFMLAGNHDRSAKGSKVSSFEFLCKIVQEASPLGKVVTHVQGELANLYDNVWAIPHCDNQDLFDLELHGALEEITGPATLLLHCNYDNHFAEQSDHSLNLSEDMAQRLIDLDITLVIAHEHQKRVLKKGKVYITGNQWPSSIADCLGNDAKYAHILGEVGAISPVETWNADQSFTKVDWTEIATLEGDFDFIRVGGTCSAESAADMISAISKLRQRSKAYVVSNAVRVDGGTEFDDLGSLTFENVSRFNVLEALLEELTEEEGKVVKQLLD